MPRLPFHKVLAAGWFVSESKGAFNRSSPERLLSTLDATGSAPASGGVAVSETDRNHCQRGPKKLRGRS